MPKTRMPKRSRRSRFVPKDETSGGFASQTMAALSTPLGENNSVITRKMTIWGLLASNGAGQIKNVLSLNPSSYTAWSTLAPLYDEFRVVGARINLFAHQVNTVTNGSSTVVVCYDNDDDSTNLTSLGNGMDYRVNTRFGAVWDTGLPRKLTAFVSAVAKDGNWATCATPNAFPHSFKVYADSLSVSTSYLDWTIELIVQFRGPIV